MRKLLFIVVLLATFCGTAGLAQADKSPTAKKGANAPAVQWTVHALVVTPSGTRVVNGDSFTDKESNELVLPAKPGQGALLRVGTLVEYKKGDIEQCAPDRSNCKDTPVYGTTFSGYAVVLNIDKIEVKHGDIVSVNASYKAYLDRPVVKAPAPSSDSHPLSNAVTWTTSQTGELILTAAHGGTINLVSFVPTPSAQSNSAPSPAAGTSAAAAGPATTKRDQVLIEVTLQKDMVLSPPPTKAKASHSAR